MSLFFKFDINMAITIEEECDFPFDDNKKMIHLSRLTKKQREEVVVDTKQNWLWSKLYLNW